MATSCLICRAVKAKVYTWMWAKETIYAGQLFVGITSRNSKEFLAGCGRAIKEAFDEVSVSGKLAN